MAGPIFRGISVLPAVPVTPPATPADPPPALPVATGAHPFAEPCALWWRCTQCSANHRLRFPRRNPGHCLNCGTATLAPVDNSPRPQ